MSEGDQMIFDALASAEARDRSIAQVDENADPEWREAAFDAVLRASCLWPDGFTTDQVWPLIDIDAGTHEPRAMGAVMRRAHLAGMITPTDDFRPTDRVTAHRNPKRIWRAT